MIGKGPAVCRLLFNSGKRQEPCIIRAGEIQRGVCTFTIHQKHLTVSFDMDRETGCRLLWLSCFGRSGVTESQRLERCVINYNF